MWELQVNKGLVSFSEVSSVRPGEKEKGFSKIRSGYVKFC